MLSKYTTYEINKLIRCIHFRHKNATKLISGSVTKKYLKSLSVILIIVLRQFRTILTYVS